MELSDKDLSLLNSKKGLTNLLSEPEIDLERTLRKVRYEKKLSKIQLEMIKLQAWVMEHKKRVVVLFEGRDAAGKGGAIRRITHHINPRYFRIVALPKPTMEEKGQWYFQRYIKQLPNRGEIVFFDRSWYNRAIVEPVNGFCTQKDYNRFMIEVNDFERMLVNDNIYLIKIYLSISKQEQKKRFEDIRNNPLKQWKMTPVDERAQELWDVYTKYKKDMFNVSDTLMAPWKIIKADRKTDARLEAGNYILNRVPYKEPPLD